MIDVWVNVYSKQFLKDYGIVLLLHFGGGRHSEKNEFLDIIKGKTINGNIIGSY